MKWNFLYQITAASRTLDWGVGGYRPQIPVLSVLNWICWAPSPNKIPGYATAWALSSEVNRPGREAYHSIPCSSEF